MRADARRRAVLESRQSDHWFGNESGKTDGLDFGFAGFLAAARSPSDEPACRRPSEMRADARRRAVLESRQSDHRFGNESEKIDGLDFGLAGFPAAARSPSDEPACRRLGKMRADAPRRSVLESCQSDHRFGNESGKTDGLDFGLAGFLAAARSPSDERACHQPGKMRADARRRSVLESRQSDHWFGNESLFIFGQPGLRPQIGQPGLRLFSAQNSQEMWIRVW